ncbi:MAG: PEP-CTERM sorting domain-containing protein [Candidatus Omnitrophota bacterium]|nr:PEP-CTERM sorting domain-containing protein [Candidatus Omnitrophota bacterium]
MKKVLLVVAAVIFLAAGNAYAIVPTIDGLMTSLTEWDGSQLFGGDSNEASISDSWDIKNIFMKVVAGDGWYFRMDTYGTPTFSGGPGSEGEEAAFKFFLDINNDDTSDYLIDLNNRNYTALGIVSVYTGEPAFTELGILGTSNGLSSIVEMYVPDSLLSTDVFFDNVALSPFGLRARLDGNGDEPDDRLPGSGYIKTPEPGSAMLLGMGLIGLVGRLFRKKAKA